MLSLSVLYSHKFLPVVLLGVCPLTSQFLSSLADTASRFIGDLRQFHLPLYSSAELDDRMQATLASKAFFCNPRLGARLSHP